MSKHTAGPWSTSKLHRDGLNYINHSPSGTFTDADAHLIAAAPDMYEALRHAEGRLTELGDINSKALRLVMAAVRKAEGLT